MTTTMISTCEGLTHVHHGARVYTPNRKDEWEVEDGHVAAVRPHGLVTKAELEAEAKRKAEGEGKDAEIAKLQARIAELQGEKAKK